MTKRIALKTLALFVLFNLLFVLLNPATWLGKLSLYNHLFPGRPRLPWGENPQRAYNLTLNNLDAMFASHAIARPKRADEFRVALIGDSATWGFLLKPEDTLAAQLDVLNLKAPDGRVMRFYNLGYPDFSLAKDALILSRALHHQPDLVVWLVTLRSMPTTVQAEHALVRHKAQPAAPNLLAQRRELADWVRLQFYGVMWAATGIDQDYPAHYEPLQHDYEKDDSFFNLKSPLRATDLGISFVRESTQLTGNTPLIIVNEPIYISNGKNSDIRYNFFYPRWAYDEYRVLMQQQAQVQGWRYVDLWDAVPSSEFTNSAVHLSPAGSKLLAQKLAAALFHSTNEPPSHR